jgi:hypothetical protein
MTASATLLPDAQHAQGARSRRHHVRQLTHMTEPPEVRAELANLGVFAADCEHPVMPMCGRSPSLVIRVGYPPILDPHVVQTHLGVLQQTGEFAPYRRD